MNTEQTPQMDISVIVNAGAVGRLHLLSFLYFSFGVFSTLTQHAPLLCCIADKMACCVKVQEHLKMQDIK